MASKLDGTFSSLDDLTSALTEYIRSTFHDPMTNLNALAHFLNHVFSHCSAKISIMRNVSSKTALTLNAYCESVVQHITCKKFN